MTYILGISAFYHDSAATLVKNGEIISAVQEERFTRVKHDSSFPINSIKFLIKEQNIKISDVNYIVFYEKPFLKFERLLETYLAFAPKGFKSFKIAIPIWLREKLFQKKFIINSIAKSFPEFDKKSEIFFSEHHLSHAASAYYPSPFEEALILTADGVGEWTTTSVAIGKGRNIEIKEEINFPHSLGLLYSAFTYYTGFEVNGGEYKLMGLAPYGTPKYKDIITENLIDTCEDGSFSLNMKYFNYATGLTMINKNFEKLFGKKTRKKDSQIEKFHMDVASSIQVVTEDIILKIVKNLKKKYDLANLCLAGGVALNCVANGKIIKEKIFKNVWVQPAAGDAGGSLGAALAFWYLELKKERKNPNNEDMMKGSYLGTSYSNDKIKDILESIGARYEKINDEKMLDQVAKEISNGKSVGWFQGKMEFGPRALGARSILADPRDKETQKNLNLKIKFRESFRPFAPAVLKEKVREWFDFDGTSPYMLIVAKILESRKIKVKENEYEGLEKLKIKRSTIPAVTHVDYSARIQTVDKLTNPKFYELIRKFNEITNCPILVNTSFNVRDEPVVNTVEDAFKCFMSTDLDLLAIENFLLKKEDQIDKI